MKRWDTVDEMLEALLPEELAEIRAARPTIPLEDGWLQAGVVAAANHNIIADQVAAKAGKSFTPKSWLRAPADFVLKYSPAKRGPIVVDQVSIDAHQIAMETRYLKK